MIGSKSTAMLCMSIEGYLICILNTFYAHHDPAPKFLEEYVNGQWADGKQRELVHKKTRHAMVYRFAGRIGKDERGA